VRTPIITAIPSQAQPFIDARRTRSRIVRDAVA